MTHDELIQRGIKWLKNNPKSTMRMPIVLAEYSCYANSIPDVIGLSHHLTVVLECKASHADFLNDKSKSHRNYIYQLGNYRYYLCPKGLIKSEEITNDWGLLYCFPHKISVIKESGLFEDTRRQEYQVMYSIIRRLTSYDGHDKMLEQLRSK